MQQSGKMSTNLTNCRSQPSRISRNVVRKDDRSHTRLARAGLAHEKNLRNQNANVNNKGKFMQIEIKSISRTRKFTFFFIVLCAVGLCHAVDGFMTRFDE